MNSVAHFTVLVVLCVAFLAIGLGINELLSRMFSKSAAYVIMFGASGVLLLTLGLHGAGPTLDCVGAGMIGGSLVFTGMLLGRRTA
jgi:hypothetical protein